MTKAEAKKHVDGATVTPGAARADGLLIWTVDLLASQNRTIDIEAASEVVARERAVAFLAAEEE